MQICSMQLLDFIHLIYSQHPMEMLHILDLITVLRQKGLVVKVFTVTYIWKNMKLGTISIEG
jgi:hypothetical protein